MRHAIAHAEVGDDVLDGDPTTRRLETRVAALLGHEAALFFPSGTQANQVALGLHARPGEEVITEAKAHLLHYEQAGAAALWGVQLRTVDTADGVLSPDMVAPLVRGDAAYFPRTAALAVENTHNAHGGTVTTTETLDALCAFSAERSIALHIDGARLWNAAAALEVPPSRLARAGTTVMVSFSKGLGCPVGACLAGPGDLLRRGVELRRRLGGAMRQSGVLAAACLFAVEHNLERLGEDHARAHTLYSMLANHADVMVRPPDTNIVMIDLRSRTAEDAARDLAKRGVRVSIFGTHRLRAVMHLGISDDDATRAAVTIRDALS